jgi:alpha-tubulin suppressor-like RCC1 family protein
VSTVPVMGLDGKNIVQIACGQQHSIALDEEGYGHGFILRGVDSQFPPNAVSCTYGATTAIVVWALGTRKTV